MSNYLRNLAETIAHPGGGVRPRLPGRFEPHPVSTGSPAAVAMEDVAPAGDMGADLHDPSQLKGLTHAYGDSGELLTDAPGPVARRQGQSAPAMAPLAPATGSEPTPAMAARETAEPDRARMVAPAPSRTAPDNRPVLPSDQVPLPLLSPQGSGHSLSQPPPVTRGIQPTSKPASAALDGEFPVARGREPHPAIPGRSRQRGEAAVAPDGIAPVLSVGLAAPTALPPERTQRPPTEPLLGRADGTSLVEPRVTEPMADALRHELTDHQPPTVRVTIGRIEIRAAMPSAPQAPAQPARRQSALSLEEYLHRRNGGKP